MEKQVLITKEGKDIRIKFMAGYINNGAEILINDPEVACRFLIESFGLNVIVRKKRREAWW